MKDRTVNILIVDDESNIRKTFGKILKHKGYNVNEAGSSSEAVSIAETKFFNIAFVDIKMPGLSGIEVLKSIKKINEDTIVVMVTAFASVDTTIEALNNGAYSYITKPVNMDEVLILIDRALEKQSLSFDNRRLLKDLEELVYTDSLTGAINRKPFMNLLEKNVFTAMRKKHKLALLFMDLEKFKQINDIYGHETGDKILIAASNKIKETSRVSDFVGRIGGDEFVLCLNDIKSPGDAVNVARKLNEAFSEKIKIDDKLIDLTVSIGIAIYPDDGDGAEDLLKNSDIAMYKAKNKKNNTFQLYNKEHTNEIIMEQALLRALDNKEFSFHFQPIVNQKGQCVFVEALLRWNNSDYGNIEPSEFIPILEKNKEINKVGKWVFPEACKQALAINKLEKYHNVKISVNLSEVQIQDENFIEDFSNILNKTGVNSNNVLLEITEKEQINDFEKVMDVMTELKKNDFCILALDDFGSGYSSFVNLQRLPIDIVKIDKYLLDNLSSEKYCDVTLDMISLIKRLDIKIIAEGVETKEQFEKLSKAGCDYFQGFYICRPQKDIFRALNVGGG